MSPNLQRSGCLATRTWSGSRVCIPSEASSLSFGLFPSSPHVSNGGLQISPLPPSWDDRQATLYSAVFDPSPRPLLPQRFHLLFGRGATDLFQKVEGMWHAVPAAWRTATFLYSPSAQADGRKPPLPGPLLRRQLSTSSSAASDGAKVISGCPWWGAATVGMGQRLSLSRSVQPPSFSCHRFWSCDSRPVSALCNGPCLRAAWTLWRQPT